MNPVQFNVYLGLCTLLSYFATVYTDNYAFPPWLAALACLFLYTGEYWAFLFKLRIALARHLYGLSGGNPNKKTGEPLEPGCMVFYAYLMRMVFRIVLGIIMILGFGGSRITEEMNSVQIGFLIAIVLFEVFVFCYTLFESHIFELPGEKDSEKDREKAWENEVRWRTKVFRELPLKNTPVKEFVASLLLFFMAVAATQLFWKEINGEFIDFILRTEKNRESASFAVITVLLSCFVLCLFFLMPVRLAFWIEEKIKASTLKKKRKYRLSLLFAGLSICSPSIVQLIRSFLL